MNITILKLQLIDIMLRRTSLIEYNQLLYSQYCSPRELKQIQNYKLKKLIHYAYNNVPYYTNVMNSYGIKPNHIQSQKDLVLFPILTKKIIKENFSCLLSTKIRSLRPVRKITGGSTGVPLQYLITRGVESVSWGSIWRAWNVGGYSPGDKVVVLAGDSIIGRGIRRSIYHRLNNWICLGISVLDEDHLKYMYDMIKKTSCKLIYAYPTPLFVLAQYMKQHNLALKVGHIVTTSEMLFPDQRNIIEHVFNCKIYDLYGANDGGVLGFECEYFNGYHLAMEKCITEIVDSSGQIARDSTVGDVILTDLENYAMPFIRYEVGDRGAISNVPCKCSRGLNRLELMCGRIKDFVELGNGKIIDGSYFTKRFRAIPGMLLFQIVQKPSKSIYAKVVPFNKNETRFLCDIGKLERTISFELSIDFHIKVDDSFERSQNQKFHYIIKE